MNFEVFGLTGSDPRMAYRAGIMQGEIMKALGALRCRLADAETDIHAEVAKALAAQEIRFDREVRLGPRARIDFLVWNFVGIEIKRGKRCSSTELIRQIERYLAFERVGALVVLTERSVALLAEKLQATKPVMVLSLSKAWGVAL